MRSRSSLAGLLLLTGVVLAGCLGGPSQPQTSAEIPPDSIEGPPPELPAWPDLAVAKIRPGVQTKYQGSTCTSNFLFRGANNTTLYLGSAAHCVGDDAKLDDPVKITGASKEAKLAYSSWLTLGLTCTQAGGECANDFALFEIDPADTGIVHPAVLHYGGPTGLADSAALKPGDKVLRYGNTPIRQGIDLTNRHEGLVMKEQGSSPTFQILTMTPGIPGDSGSGILTKDGQAAGVTSTLCFAPCTGQNGIVGLQKALEIAKDKAAMDVEVVTWDLLEDGILP